MAEADRDLVLRLREGDPTAFEALYERHKDRLYRHALVHAGGRSQVAEEVVQDVFLSLYEATDAPDHVGAYLLAATRNRTLNAVQRREGRAEPLGDADASQLVRDEASPEDTAQRGEEARILADALLGLSAEQREVVLLRTYEGLSWKEVAELVGAPVPTVSSRYRSALEALRTRCRSLSHA